MFFKSLSEFSVTGVLAGFVVLQNFRERAPTVGNVAALKRVSDDLL